MTWEMLDEVYFKIFDIATDIQIILGFLPSYFIYKFPELKQDFKIFRISEWITFAILVIGIFFGAYMKFLAFALVLASIGAVVSIGLTFKMYMDYRKLKKSKENK